MRPSRVLSVVVMLFAVCVPGVAARAGDVAGVEADRVALLEARIAALEARLQRLEGGASASAVSAPPSTATASTTASTTAGTTTGAAPGTPAAPAIDLAALAHRVDASAWTEKLSWRGDFRVRHESLDQDAHDARQRERIRARFGLTAKVSDTLTASFGLATGSDDPISRNQTLDGANNSKQINFEQAYLSWKPADVPGLEVLAGKFKQSFRNPGDAALIWDADLNPEGLSLGYQRTVGDAQLFATAAGWWIDERAGAAEALMIGVQAGAKLPTFGNGDVTIGVGRYAYTNTQGRAPYYDGNARGNTLLGGGYAEDFRNIELFAEWRGSIAGMNAMLFADGVRNTAADDFDTGYAVGGSLARQGFSVGYLWKELEADAALGTLADSDFGLGGTDFSGHLITLGYEASKAMNFKFSWSIAEHGEDARRVQDADRVQLDMQVRF